MRIACLVAIGVALLALAAPVSARGDEARPASVGAVAQINFGELFGNENEADENEPEEGGSEAGAPAQESSGPSLLVVLLLVILALVAARIALFYVRLKRRVRNEGWLALLLPRRPSARGRAEDLTDRQRILRERWRRSG
jgi:hypothetical protein